jgi:hypothetical protein
LAGSTRLLAAAAASFFVAGLVAAVATLLAPPAPVGAECVFPVTPVTYEDLEDRRLFLDAIDLAAFDMLFPGDRNFGLPALEAGPRESRFAEAGKVPPSLLKALSWIESSITQTAGDVPFGSIGPALVSFDCGHGITQVTSGMTAPQGENGNGSPEQALIATHFAYNIARGAFVLADKWNDAPEKRPVAGIDTNAHPAIVENWYFAVWAYNGFTGPGANKSNHPMDPIYGGWPRPQYSCGPQSDGLGHNRANYPYQELVFGCAANPPEVEGDRLWQGQELSLPDLNQAEWAAPLSLDNFIFPYSHMDIPTPRPFHLDESPAPAPSLRDRVLGQPSLAVESNAVEVGYISGSGYTTESVLIRNTGSGLLVWYAIPTEPWIIVSPATGGAAANDLPCERDAPCERATELQISVDPSRAPPGRRVAAVRVQALGTNQSAIIAVEVTNVSRIGAPGVTRN